MEISEAFSKVTKHYGVSKTAIRGKRRKEKLVTARTVLSFYFIRELKLTTTKAGKYLNRDHSTIVQYFSLKRCHYGREGEYEEDYKKIFG